MWKYLTVLCGIVPFYAQAATPDTVLADLHAVIPPVQNAKQNDRKQILCLALGLYHEARGEPEIGRRAVGHVILNRIRQSGQSACPTIWKTGQFQWTRRPKKKLLPREEQVWKELQEQAVTLMRSDPDITNGATMFYNARVVTPKWAKRGVVTAQYGDHVFIRL